MLILNKKHLLKNILFLLFFFCPSLFLGQIPIYYQTINLNLSGDSLKNELSNLIISTHHTQISYTSSSSIDTWDVIKLSDLFSLDTSKVMLVYGYDDTDVDVQNDRTRSKYLSCHSSPCTGLWNREHVFPKSLASPNLVTGSAGAGTDVHNLRACDYSTNASRSNKKFDAGNGNSSSNNQGNWYPGDEWKGDVARIIMYMYLRYPNQCAATSVGEGTQLYSPNGDIPDIFLEWNAEDSVSNFEELRNNEIANFQGNRNPFIDNPHLATLIWNGPIAENKWNINSNIFNIQINNVFVHYNSFNKEISILNNSNRNLNYSELFNINGQKIRNFQDQKFNASSLDKGIYLVRMNFEKYFFLKKVCVF